MKVYQLVSGHHNYDEGWVERVLVTYTTKEEAEKAKSWLNTVPDDPYYPQCELSVKEIEIEEVFTPWISDEEIAAMQKGQDDYGEYMEQMYGTDWCVPDDCSEE